MKSSRPQPLHLLAGRTMLQYMLDSLADCKTGHVVVVVGHGAERVTKKLQAEEPDLFEAPAFQPQAEQEEVLEHDLPPPVYRPQPAAQAPATMARPAPQGIEADAAEFVAPRPRGTAGQPSPEALARLQAAVSKNPAMTAQRPAAQRAAAAPQPAAPQAAAGGKPRFGIGSLINRMAGHLESAGERGQPQAGRVQPPVASYDEEPDPSGDDNRIEIPAFLRRQAN